MPTPTLRLKLCPALPLEARDIVAVALESFGRVRRTLGFATGLEDAFEQMSPTQYLLLQKEEMPIITGHCLKY